MIRILQQDNRIVKAVFALIIGAAIITMVITLVPGIFDNGSANNAAVFASVRTPGFFGKLAGDTDQIQMTQVEQALQRQTQGRQVPQFYMGMLMSRVGQQLVERKVLEREANRLGLQVTDEDLRRYLKTGPLSAYLFPEGKYIGDEAYVNLVQQNGMSVADFEKDVKSDIELQRLQSLVTAGASVSDAAVRADYLQSGTKIKFDYAVVSAADLKKTINPSDADLQAFFKQNAPRYATAVPEQRKITFFTFDPNAIPGGKPTVADADIQAYYNAHADGYKVDEQVKTRHILISVAKDADAKTDAAAKAKAQGVLDKIKAGGNFAELAKANSDDPGSKNTGGELPMMPTAQLDPAYGQAAMKLNPGQTSDLVRSQFGYHIIQTEEKQTAHVKALPEVKDTIAAQLEQQKGAAAQQSYAAQLAAEAKSKGMEATANAHGMHVVTTDFLDSKGTIPQLADSAPLLQQAFATPKGAAPAPVDTGEGYAIFQVADIAPAHPPTFDAWKSHIVDDYREQKTPELLNTTLAKLADRAKVLNDLKKAAAESNIPLKSSDLVGRDAQVPGIGALTGPAAAAFNLNPGNISAPINLGETGAILQLTDKQQPSAQDIATNLSATRDKLLNQRKEEMFEVFAGTLMQKYEKAGAITYNKTAGASPLGQ